nr:MAG TPA: hypothetical protein [Caudoviricetes sp.]
MKGTPPHKHHRHTRHHTPHTRQRTVHDMTAVLTQYAPGVDGIGHTH